MAETNRSTRTSIQLRTQKQGRQFAIALLRKIERMGSDQFICTDREPDPEPGKKALIFRKGPQSDVVLCAFERVMYYATPPAILGFFTVMTDYIGTALDGTMEASGYARMERTGKMQTWKLAQLPRAYLQPLLDVRNVAADW